MTTRTITKKTGEVFTVLLDDADAAYYDKHTWCMSRDDGYVSRRIERIGTKKRINLHRELLKARKGRYVDHINGYKLDNRRSNLRLCSKAQNCHNRKRPITNTSGYTGVSLNNNGRWRADVRADGKLNYLGVFDSALEAAIARDQAAIRLHKDFARLNFPELVLAS